MARFTQHMTGSRTVLKAVPAALLAWACSLNMADAAVYAPDNFANGGGTNLETMVMVKDNDDRVVIGGAFTTVEGQAGYQGVARFNADDSLDDGFKVVTDAFVKAIAVQDDGKILIGGAFHWVRGTGSATNTPFWGITRLNSDGTVDPAFQAAPTGQVKSNHNVRGIAVQPDGKIVIGGYFTRIDGVARNRIARLNTDGTLDNSFDVGTGANSNIEDVKLQADGKILISGSFTQVQGESRWGIARLNADGSLDTTFEADHPTRNGAWDGSFPVYQLALQSDGKVLYAGGTHRYGDEIHWRIGRLENDGRNDSDFNAYVNWWASSVAVQTVGGEEKIVVGGDFGRAGQANTATGGVIAPDAARQRIARFNLDGTLDTSFDTSFSANSWVWTVLPNDDADGTVYLGGKFTNVAGMARRGIARLAPLDPTKQTIAFEAPEPAVYSALNGVNVAWSPTPPTSSSANLPVTYSSLSTSICTVDPSTGAVSLVTPAVTGLCTIQADAEAGTQEVGGLTYDVDPAPAVQQSIQIDAPPDQSIVFPEQASPVDVADGAFAINPAATASSGLPVSYSSLTPDVCTVAGTTVTPITGGVCSIAADQAGGTVGAVAFDPAAQVVQAVTVQSAQTIDFPTQTNASPSVVVGFSFAIAPLATASSSLPVTYSSTTPEVCTTDGTNVTVLSTGTCTIEANQEGNDYFTSAVSVSQSLTVTALPRVATPVPTLGTGALAVLAGLLGWVGMRRRRH